MSQFPRPRRRLLTVLILLFLLLVVVVTLLLRSATRMPGESYRGAPAPPTAEEAQSAPRLEAMVRKLSEEIGERNAGRPDALAAAADWIDATLVELGYEVARFPFSIGEQRFENLEAISRCGIDGAPCLVIGGHYDSVPGCPGADDNASGVAGVLELARLLRGRTQRVDLRFVLFANEEPPYFQTETMGSLVYARALAERGVEAEGMLCLETIGYFTAEPKTQRYPFPFSVFYPDTGDFIGFVGDLSSRAFVRRVIEEFRSTTSFPSEGLTAPGFIPGVGWSDHWSFWQVGVPAVMITDTAPFRNPGYHLVSDTADPLDWAATARVVRGLERVVLALDREE